MNQLFKNILFSSCCFFAFYTTLTAQTTVCGKVYSIKGKTIPNANVGIKNSYDGTSTDSGGYFSFTANDTGKVILLCSLIGYLENEKEIVLNGKPQKLEIILWEAENQLETITISAGAIEASDEKKATVLKPLDIVTTAGANGDITGALKTLPGAQQVGESEGLFVRGGTNAETKMLIDGMIVNNPFFSSVPDIAQRSRFSPFLFKGTVFSTGGYSAQYGQALSSVLALETQDLPDQTSSTLGISSVGVNLGRNQLWAAKKMSMGADINYSNLLPYVSVIRQKQEYTKAPQFVGSSYNFRKKLGSTGIIKFFTSLNVSTIGIKQENVDSAAAFKNSFDLGNKNWYSILTYKDRIGEKWVLFAGTSYSTNLDRINYNGNKITNNNELSQGRLVLSRGYGANSIFRAGAEYQYVSDRSSFNEYKQSAFDNYTSAFFETDIYLSRKIVVRLGERYDNSTIISSSKFSSRGSFALKTGTHSQVSLAYGEFYQKPNLNFLWYNNHLGFEKATHYILNFQHVSDSITFRSEIYYKKYSNLVKTYPAINCLNCNVNLSESDTSNTGGGYAQGIDLFWRDKKTFKGIDYWISYTYLDTKRNYLNYPSSVMPSFAASHNGSVVIKKFWEKIMAGIGITYTYSGGRPYYNPNNPVFLGDRTPDYHAVGINANYIRKIGNAFTVFVFSVTNALGNKQVYSYRYSYDGSRRQEIGPPALRSFFIGMFMSFGADRTKDIINNNN